MLAFDKIPGAGLSTLVPEYNSACDTKDSVVEQIGKVAHKFDEYISLLHDAIMSRLGYDFTTYKPHKTRYYILEVEKDKLYSLVKFTNSYGYLEAHTCCTKSSIKECKVVCERWR